MTDTCFIILNYSIVKEMSGNNDHFCARLCLQNSSEILSFLYSLGE